MTDDFDAWLDWVFAPSAPDQRGPAPGAWSEEADPGGALDRLARLFTAPDILIDRYTPDQIGRGLWFLIDPSCSSHMLALTNPRLDWSRRAPVIQAIGPLYERLFQRVCDPRLSHDALAASAVSPVNHVCYMFWEIAPLDPLGPEATLYGPVCLAVMDHILNLPHEACREAALHGLGHWRHAQPAVVEATIGRFVADPTAASPRLLAYARSL